MVEPDCGEGDGGAHVEHHVIVVGAAVGMLAFEILPPSVIMRAYKPGATYPDLRRCAGRGTVFSGRGRCADDEVFFRVCRPR